MYYSKLNIRYMILGNKKIEIRTPASIFCSNFFYFHVCRVNNTKLPIIRGLAPATVYFCSYQFSPYNEMNVDTNQRRVSMDKTILSIDKENLSFIFL